MPSGAVPIPDGTWLSRPEIVAGSGLADARPGAAWRSEFGIAEPSPQFGEAIECLDERLQAAARSGDTPTFDAVLVAAYEDRSGEQTIAELVWSVLRSTLEQLRSRQVAVPDS